MTNRFFHLRRSGFVVTALASVLVAGSAQAQEKVTYLLDWLPTGKAAPAYVGIRQGFFAKEGLEVTVRSSRGATDVISKLATGANELGSGGLSSLMAARAAGPMPVKAVYSIFNKQPDTILTVKGKGITSLKDLKGKSLATASFTSSNDVWPFIASANGLDLSTVTFLKVDNTALTPLLAAGKVDAIITWMTSVAGAEAALKQSGKEVVALPWWDYGLDGYSLSIFASDKMIKERPDVLARFLRAYRRATEFALDNPEIAAKDYLALVPDANAETALAEFKASMPLTRNEISAKFGMGTFDADLTKRTWEWVAKSQNFPLDKIDPTSVVDQFAVPKS